MASSDCSAEEEPSETIRSKEEERKFEEYHKKLANIVKALHSDLRQRVLQSNGKCLMYYFT